MGDERLEAVLRRVEDLEAEVRRWRRAAMALMLSAVALTTLGAAVPRGRVVEAQKFVLKDTAGGGRAGVGARGDNKTNSPRLLNESPALAPSPRASAGGAPLALRPQTGRPRRGGASPGPRLP